MQLPLDLRFVGMAPSKALETVVRERVRRIERVCPELVAWRVTVEQPHRHQTQGRPFSVRVDVTLPGNELTVERVHDADVGVAVRDAFAAVRRRLDEVLRMRRGEVKEHAEEREEPLRDEEGP